MGSRRWPIASSRRPTRSTRARCARSCSTRWTSSASAASRSRPRRCASSSTSKDGETYQLQLIDTPGHVDFTYEVSRSLAACEGALLVVDASQGVEAQTVANTYLAVDAGLELIPCLNKIDLPGAEPERVAEEIADLIGEQPDEVLRISAKTGDGVAEVLEELIARVPPPDGDPEAPPRALIFDSEYDQYRGVIAYIRVVDGTFTQGRGDPRDGGRHRRPTSTTSASSRPRMTPVESLVRRRGRLPHHRHQGRRQPAGRRHADLAREPGRPSRCPATARSSRWSSAACSRSSPTSSRSCATRSRSSRSTTPRCSGSPRTPTRSASASAAASSACCTWTSCASAWSASTTSS